MVCAACRDEGVAEVLNAVSENVAQLEVLEARGCGAAAAAAAAAGAGLPLMQHLRHLDLSWSTLGSTGGSQAVAALAALGVGLGENSSLRTLNLCATTRAPCARQRAHMRRVCMRAFIRHLPISGL